MTSRTKSSVIAEASKIIASYHPKQKDYLRRWETWRTTLDWLCRDIPEFQGDLAAKRIVGYVKDILAQKRRLQRKNRRTAHIAIRHLPIN
ncbi:hypothetical protein [Scytonema sp. PRP1]|uniref:hypothetical protein n=1 Tax=Scytonema sp. PRP1 TaxID=3120513 RepID=UPI00300C94C8